MVKLLNEFFVICLDFECYNLDFHIGNVIFLFLVVLLITIIHSIIITNHFTNFCEILKLILQGPFYLNAHCTILVDVLY